VDLSHYKYYMSPKKARLICITNCRANRKNSQAKHLRKIRCEISPWNDKNYWKSGELLCL